MHACTRSSPLHTQKKQKNGKKHGKKNLHHPYSQNSNTKKGFPPGSPLPPKSIISSSSEKLQDTEQFEKHSHGPDPLVLDIDARAEKLQRGEALRHDGRVEREGSRLADQGQLGGGGGVDARTHVARLRDGDREGEF